MAGIASGGRALRKVEEMNGDQWDPGTMLAVVIGSGAVMLLVTLWDALEAWWIRRGDRGDDAE